MVGGHGKSCGVFPTLFSFFFSFCLSPVGKEHGNAALVVAR